MLRCLNLFFLLGLLISFMSCGVTKDLYQAIEVAPSEPVILDYLVVGSLTKRLIVNISNSGEYAGLSVFADENLLVDDFNFPIKGSQQMTAIVRFHKLGEVKLRFQSLDEKLTVNSFYFDDVLDIEIPFFTDISVTAGLDKVSSIKYGGPSIADIDNDGDYDFIANNHNAETSKLYWNNGDGTVTKHDKDLARWFKHDLHGTSLGDFDNDGDLDLVLAEGGGNGTNPSRANFYLNNNSVLVRYTGDVGIDRGGRGRGSRWIDMDLDGDLDLFLVNEASLLLDKPQQYFYQNLGDGRFTYKSISGIEDVEESRVLVTDLNNDNIDDVVFYSPLSIWKGNGDFSFTDITSLLPVHINDLRQIMAVTDLDIDNDGDLDLYLARGMLFEHGEGEEPSLDFNPIDGELSLKTRGYKGVDAFDFTADHSIRIVKYYYLAQGEQLGKDYPVFMGSDKNVRNLKSDEDLEITQDMASGWPSDFTENGFYLGYTGNSKWKAALVRDGNIFWQYRFSLLGLTGVTPDFIPQNRNQADVLLRNDGSHFTDVSKEWEIPKGGNALGVTTADFNNDSHQDLFIYRWGRIGARISDIMLLNSGNGTYETVTMHGANDVGGPGNGDMGQAFDFDLDGKVDLLNGSEGGEWYLYSNQTNRGGNYVTIRVGYSPEDNVDPISAEIVVTTAEQEFRKRVGSAGEIFSQSLMNIVHFGLGEVDSIKRIRIRWRNGETVEFFNKEVNSYYDTDFVDPTSLLINPIELREGTTSQLSLKVTPSNANTNLEWSSSDNNILSVNDEGMVNVLGVANQTAIVTATSQSNGMTASTQFKIVNWKPVPVKSISINANSNKLYTGQELSVIATTMPTNADDSKLIWTSGNTDIITVNEYGIVRAVGAGETFIRAYNIDQSVFGEMKFDVEQFVEPYIEILNKEQYENQPLNIDDTIEIMVRYHAGSGNKVISADEGGIRFWLRHFKSKWIPEKDKVLTYKDALYTESGTANMLFSLEDTTPTGRLPEGHFYQLRVTFTSSDGNMYDDHILPLQIISKLD